MTLGELIAEIEQIPGDAIFGEGFGAPASWRGSYDEIAFEPKRDVSAASMLGEALSAVGATFEGYKGGKYVMSLHTPCNVASWGVYGGDDDALTSWRWKYMVSTIRASRS